MHSTPRCAIGIGSNLSVAGFNPLDIIEASIIAIDNVDLTVESISRFYKTASFPPNSGPDYINAALVIRTDLSAASLLQRLHIHEANMQRKRDQRWDARSLDLDLLFYEDEVWPSEQVFRHWQYLSLEDQMRLAPNELILPHPRMHQRPFVLAPLMDICSDWVHPVLGLTVRELFSKIDGQDLGTLQVL